MKKLTFSLIALSSIALSACGGGSSGGGSGDIGSGSNPADGFWSGSTNNGYSYDLAIQGNGDVWLIYYDGGYVSGMVHGHATGDANNITATDINDYDFDAGSTYTADVEANLNSNQSIVGTITYPSQEISTGFSGDYLPLYDETPSLETLEGPFIGASGNSTGVEGAYFEVDQEGSITGESEYGCGFSGNASPDNQGNLYTVSLTFNSSDCLYEGRTFSGIMVYDESTGFVYAGAVGSRDSEGYVFLGERYVAQ